MANAIRRLFREWGIERRRKRDRPTVDLKQDEIVYTRRRKPVRMAWGDVVRLDAGVHALVSGDLFYIVIAPANGTAMEIDEFVDGFSPLETAIFARLPEVREKWLELYRAHAHRDILVTLWKRE